MTSPDSAVAPLATAAASTALVFVGNSMSTPWPTVKGPSPTVFTTGTFQDDEILLEWESDASLGEGDTERCERLVVTGNHQAQYGKCSARPRVAPLSGLYLDDILARFAAFEYRSGDTTLTFRGHGRVAGQVWQRAIATWASSTFNELYSGRACAACRTSLAWSFGSIPSHAGLCGMLVVLDYGYAYREQVPCAGHEAQVVRQGWLTTEEWTQLAGWMESRSPAYGSDGTSYMTGKGSQPMSPHEMKTLGEWAQQVYDRLQ